MQASDVRRVGVIGAGQMGQGIAQVCATAGIEVVLSDRTKELAEKGRDRIGSLLGRLVEKGKLGKDDRDATVARIAPREGFADFSGVELAIEAATENVDLKLALFGAADEALAPGAILASNTSSISISKLAASTKRPELVVGMHFMNPVPLMQLCEVIRGVQTSDDTLRVVRDLAARLGKTVITSQDHPGFLVNRILIPLLNEACFALQEGVGTAADIDTGARLGLNHPMGPLELADLIGLDTVLAIAEVLQRDLGDDKYRPATILRNLVAAGWLGKKAGRGFYVYDAKGQKTSTRPER